MGTTKPDALPDAKINPKRVVVPIGSSPPKKQPNTNAPMETTIAHMEEKYPLAEASSSVVNPNIIAFSTGSDP